MLLVIEVEDEIWSFYSKKKVFVWKGRTGNHLSFIFIFSVFSGGAGNVGDAAGHCLLFSRKLRKANGVIFLCSV